MTDLERKLDLLAVFHFVFGGLLVVMFLVPLIYIGLGGAFYFGALSDLSGGPEDSIKAVSLFFLFIGVLAFILGQAFAWLTIYSGKQIRRRRKISFSIILACLICLFFPLGTFLGIFTFIILSDPQTKKLYQDSQSSLIRPIMP